MPAFSGKGAEEASMAADIAYWPLSRSRSCCSRSASSGVHPLIETNAALVEFCDLIGNSDFIAVDTEFMRENTRSEEHTSELQSLMRTSYADFCSKKKNNTN